MNPETINAIKEALAPVADKIGQGAEYGWIVVLKQQYVVAVGNFIMSAVGLLLLVGAIFAAKHAYKRMTTPEDRYDMEFPVAPFLTILLGIPGALMLFGGLYDGIAHLINPDYYALEFFIGLVH